MTRLFLLSLAALALGGCSVSAEEETGAQTADLVAPVWTTDQAQTGLVFFIHGSGEVRAGSACAPGSAYVYMTPSTPSALSVNECAGEPARMRTRRVDLSAEQSTALVAAARAVAFSDKTTCDTESESPYMMMTTYPITAGAFPGATVRTEHLACEPGLKVASGLENVNEVLSSIFAASPALPASVFVGTPPATLHEAVWNERSTSIMLTVGGEGSTPQGSACAAGSSQLTFTERDDSNGYVSGMVCTPVAEGGRLVQRPLYRPLDAARVAKVRAVLPRLRTLSVARCTPGARFLSAFISGKDEAGAPAYASVTGVENACVLGVDRTFVDLAPLRAVFDEVSAP